jgi:NAD(P)H-nitrite reductase large subunit
VSIKATALEAHSIVILGAGLVGIDAASGLLALDKRVSIVEMQDHMLSFQLDKTAAGAYEKAFAERGGQQYYGIGAKKICADAQGKVRSIVLSNGAELPCDMIVCATGVRANTAFLAGSGIELDPKGLMFDTRGQTNDPDVFGAGDVSGKSPIWPVAVTQGLVAGTNMSGGDMELTDFFASKTTMNFWGVKTLSLGIHTPPDETYTTEIEGGDAGYKGYKKIIHRDGKIYGAIIQGDLSYSGILTQLICARIDVSRVRKPLFKIDYSDFFNMKDNFEFSYMEV